MKREEAFLDEVVRIIDSLYKMKRDLIAYLGGNLVQYVHDSSYFILCSNQ